MLVKTLLKEIQFFWDFTDEECDRLVNTERFFSTYQDGEFLITEGASDESLLVLIKGDAHVIHSSNPDQVIATLKPGAVVGEVSFLTKRQRATSIIAAGEVTAFRIDPYSMTQSHMDPGTQTKIKNQLIEILVQRLENTNKALVAQKESNFALARALREQVLAMQARRS
ncbi:MAG: cyclic nucleotide-binding domain-containing protein [Magnetococcales bacterium]|nr:cyclic nucleotide-binding domain-containing protein [Magnetococcales bacterium]